MEAILNRATDAAPISQAQARAVLADLAATPQDEAPAPAGHGDDIGVFLRRFDGRMHGRMNNALDQAAWAEIHSILANAFKHQNLRGNVRERFFKACPHPEMVLALKATTGFAKPDAIYAAPVVVDPPRKYDGRLHGLIKDAELSGSKVHWQLACHALTMAAEEGQLRYGVQKHFTLQCPPAFSELSDEVAKLAVAVSEQVVTESPLRNKTMSLEERRAYEKRRDDRRTKRLENRPVGRNESLSEPNSKKKAKGGKKK